jgi:hypothetical protein
VSIPLEDLLASFQRHLRATAKAPRTIELYSQSVRYFSRWLVDRDREPVLDELTRHAIAAWLGRPGRPPATTALALLAHQVARGGRCVSGRTVSS